MMFPVNEVFETIQGEGTWTGTPAVFIRLQGCDVGCPWCDTKHTWTVDPQNLVVTTEMVGKVEASPTFARLSSIGLAELVSGFRARHVVITGGEPCVQDLTSLTRELITAGYRAQVETSATRPVLVWPGTWVTVSPKIGMTGGRPLLESAVNRADEIKMPVGKPADVDHLKMVLDMRTTELPAIWLQPLSLSEKSTRLCVEAATANGWRVSLQTHKFAGIR